MTRISSRLVAATFVLISIACAPPDEGDPPGEDAGPETESLTLTYVNVFDDAQPPMSGVSVTLYDGSTELDTLATDDDGKVVFTVAAGAGPLTATLHGNGATVTTRLGLEGGDDLTIPATYRQGVPDAVTLSGTVTGHQDSAHRTSVFAYPGLTGWNEMSPAYSIEVPAGEELSLLVLEFELRSDLTMTRGYAQDVFQWTTLTQAAVTENTTLDIAFDGTTPDSTSGSFMLPDVASDFFDTCGGSFLTRVDLTGEVSRVSGVATRIAVDAADARKFDYETAHRDDGPAADTNTVFRCFLNDGTGTFSVVPGVPAGAHDLSGRMLEPATVAGNGAVLSLYDEVSWDAHEQADALPQMIVFNEDGEFVWVVQAEAGMDRFTLPGFPPGVSRADLFGEFGTTATGTFRLCNQRDGEFICDDLAVTPIDFAI
jgi:hypothetical protein